MPKDEKGAKAPETNGASSPYVNDVTLVGHCIDQPKALPTAKGGKRAGFRVEIPRGREKTWVFVVAWDKLAEECERAPKNALMSVKGRLRSWKDETKGVSQLEVVAQAVTLLTPPAPTQQEMAGV